MREEVKILRVDVGGKTVRVAYKLRVIDLDVKHSHKIPKYHSLDREIVQHYLHCCEQRQQRHTHLRTQCLE